MQLTTHFKLSEFTRSNKAQQLGLDNTPTAAAMLNLPRTARMLEGVRALLGDVAITITSGYRGPALNKAVGGVTSSDHSQGLAADIVAPDFGTPYEIAKALAPRIDELGIGQVIYEVNGKSRWVHISARMPEKVVNRVITIEVGKGATAGIQRV